MSYDFGLSGNWLRLYKKHFFFEARKAGTGTTCLAAERTSPEFSDLRAV
jgi:tRNA U34 5-methylaminomethyl-2-thiouridine-forming methyltransferase MnmC